MKTSLIVFFLIASLLKPEADNLTFVYEQVLLKDVISDIEKKTEYRFLYRDALISGIRISFNTTTDRLFSDMKTALEENGLSLQLDLYRNQVLVFKQIYSGFKGDIRGYVLDAESGSRLPYATITWKEGDQLKGISANESGFFRITLNAEDPVFQFSASYVGYEPRLIEMDLMRVPDDIAVRLQVQPFSGNEILIEDARYHISGDTAWVAIQSLASSLSFSEPGALRSLKPLPSVVLNGAFSNGINIRGSKTDAFQLLLDGVPVYNHYHLFGIFDPFNQDALQTVGFYYSIAPATLSAPPGGTLSYLTRSGSQSHIKGSAGISSSAYRMTVEGPMRAGRGSWLVAGRNSYMNNRWFGNDKLVAWGLDVGRETEPIPSFYQEIEARTVFPKDSDVQFYDYHGKIFLEASDGSSWTGSFYTGKDITEQTADRYRLAPGNGLPSNRLELSEVSTSSDWGSFSASVQQNKPLGSNYYLKNMAALTRYESRYSKEDFSYIRYNRNLDRLIPSINPFSHENSLREYKFGQQAEWFRGIGKHGSFGYTLHYIETDYKEQSIIRPNYTSETAALHVDVFAQYDQQLREWLNIQSGLRVHYFSIGEYLRLSPRLSMQFVAHPILIFTAGYSRNYQFLHSVSIKNSASAEVWISSLSNQKPAYADQLTGGFYLRPFPGFFVQLESYYKFNRYVRFHEVNPSLLITRDFFLDSPWFYNSTSTARGVEFLTSYARDRLDISAMYTLSRVEIQNENLNNGIAFDAEWDRRHQFTLLGNLRLTPFLSAQAALYYATGVPNTAMAFDTSPAGEPDRLTDYFRTDTGIKYRYPFRNTTLEATISVFNLFDRKNTWYRTPVMVIDRTRRPVAGELTYINLDVYDLGFHPSFDVSIRF